MTTEAARYPIGRFTYPGPYSVASRLELIDTIASLPDRLEATLDGMEPEGWETPYRPGGWTVTQVVHHLPDSHLHAYQRFMRTLVEDRPTVDPYDERRWVEAAGARAFAPQVSLAFLRALHDRWVMLLRSITDTDAARTLHHTEHGRTFSLDELIGQYAWHGEHHLAHVRMVTEGRR